MTLVLVSLVSFSCRRPTAPPPPPEAPAPPPPPPPPVPTITISASPATITAGGSTTLQWSSQNATGVTIEPALGNVATNGTQSVTPNASVTYTATAMGPGGNDTANVRVTVNQPPPPPPPPPPAPDPGPSVEELFRTSVVPIYFDYDRSEIRQDQVARLQGNVRFLQQNAGIQFTISGHADERGTQEYNIGLGDRRANVVRQFMVDNGIAATRINVISFGEERPTCTVSNEACWGQNRRAEFDIR